MRGQVEWVTILPERAFTAADAAAGANTLQVLDASEISRAREVRIAESQVVGVVSATVNGPGVLDTIVLAEGLDENFEAGLPVESWPLVQTTWAGVSIGDDLNPRVERAMVGQELQDKLALAEGPRERDAREVVTLEDGPRGLTVVAVDGRAQTDASNLTGTLPQEIKDQVEGGGVTPVAPESSPVPTVDGFAGLLLARWLGVLNETAVMYDIHVSASNAAAPSESTLLDSVPSTIYSIRTLPNGSALLYDTTYYVAIWARSDDQYAPAPSAWVPGVMDKTRSADIAAGAIDGMTITGATIRSAATGQRIQFDSEALKAFAPDGTTVTAMLEAVAGALRLQGGLDLNANGELNIYDTAPDVGSRLTVSNGRLTVFYDGAEVGSIDAEFNGSANVARIFHNADSVSLGFEADNVYVGVSSPQVAVGTSAGAVTVGQAADNVDVGYSAGTDTHVGGGGAGSTTTVGFLGDSTSIQGGTVALGEVGGIVQLLGQRLRSLADPTTSTDAATKNYVDTRKVTDLAAPTANFSMNSRKITNLADATAATDAVNKGYVDTAAAPTAWTSLPLQSGYIAASGKTPQFRLMTGGRNLQLVGAVAPSSGTLGTANYTVGILPVGFRPSHEAVFLVGMGNGFRFGRIILGTDGTVVVNPQATGAAAVYLDNILIPMFAY